MYFPEKICIILQPQLRCLPFEMLFLSTFCLITNLLFYNKDNYFIITFFFNSSLDFSFTFQINHGLASNQAQHRGRTNIEFVFKYLNTLLTMHFLMLHQLVLHEFEYCIKHVDRLVSHGKIHNISVKGKMISIHPKFN